MSKRASSKSLSRKEDQEKAKITEALSQKFSDETAEKLSKTLCSKGIEYAYQKTGELLSSDEKPKKILSSGDDFNSIVFEEYRQQEKRYFEDISTGIKVRKTKGEKCKNKDRGGKVCGSEEYLYIPVQTRSADEGMTIFAVCARCGKRKRIG